MLYVKNRVQYNPQMRGRNTYEMEAGDDRTLNILTIKLNQNNFLVITNTGFAPWSIGGTRRGR